MKFSYVCEHCAKTSTDEEATLEFNFRQKAIFFICPFCKKENIMQIARANSIPLPKTRLVR
jgi:transposase-like protein